MCSPCVGCTAVCQTVPSVQGTFMMRYMCHRHARQVRRRRCVLLHPRRAGGTRATAADMSAGRTCRQQVQRSIGLRHQPRPTISRSRTDQQGHACGPCRLRCYKAGSLPQSLEDVQPWIGPHLACVKPAGRLQDPRKPAFLGQEECTFTPRINAHRGPATGRRRPATAVCSAAGMRASALASPLDLRVPQPDNITGFKCAD